MGTTDGNRIAICAIKFPKGNKTGKILPADKNYFSRYPSVLENIEQKCGFAEKDKHTELGIFLVCILALQLEFLFIIIYFNLYILLYVFPLISSQKPVASFYLQLDIL